MQHHSSKIACPAFTLSMKEEVFHVPLDCCCNKNTARSLLWLWEGYCGFVCIFVYVFCDAATGSS